MARVAASGFHEHLLLPESTLIQVDKKPEPLPIGWRTLDAIIRSVFARRILVVGIDADIGSATLSEGGIQHHPAINEQGCANDVVGVIGGQPYRGLSDVFRLPDAAVGDLLE